MSDNIDVNLFGMEDLPTPKIVFKSKKGKIYNITNDVLYLKTVDDVEKFVRNNTDINLELLKEILIPYNTLFSIPSEIEEFLSTEAIAILRKGKINDLLDDL